MKMFLIQKIKQIFSRNLNTTKSDDTSLYLSNGTIINNHISINNEDREYDNKDSSDDQISDDSSNKNDFGSNKNDFGSNKNDFGSNKNDKNTNVNNYNIIEIHENFINIDDNKIDQGVSTNRFPPERTNSKEALQPFDSQEINMINVIENDNDVRSRQETVMKTNENENIIENKLGHNDVLKNKTFTLYDTVSVINMKFNEVIGIIFR
jgi:hypothetical protein